MERRKFFTVAGLGAAAAVVGSAATSCSKNSVSTNEAPSNVDFTLDMSNNTYSGLKTKGAYTYKDNIIIAHTSADEYVALSDICTHQGCTVGFNGVSQFPCPCHGALYDVNGSVLRGPATRPLKKYTTSLNGNSLRVQS
ncbi:MAG TPA: ubiquinol-cytochrome c reductase iron-sulfur subunit [Bacteroidales bacterium]|nr:ubiquinol-cytochrome c reductase iron-sulfur subunit [Bacteroidales bacterium]